LIVWCSLGQLESPGAVTAIGKVRSKSLDEASGLIRSSHQEGVFWTHNDGDDGRLYAVRSDGSVVTTIKIRERFSDWEDIAADAKGNLLLADTGNNSRSRKTVTIYRIREPDPQTTNDVTAAEAFRLTFPGKPFNCESLIVAGEHGYLISKVDKGLRASLYRFSLTATKKKQVLEEVLTLPVEEQVTAADLSLDGRRLAVLSDAALYVFDLKDGVESAAGVNPKRFTIPVAKAEGCCFTSDGVLVIAESGDILRVHLPAPTTR
jgi:hypothetical protein